MKLTTVKQNQTQKGPQQDNVCDISIVMQSTFGASAHPIGSAPIMGMLTQLVVFGLQF